MMPEDLKELLRAFNDHAVKHPAFEGFGVPSAAALCRFANRLKSPLFSKGLVFRFWSSF
jgi:hypothetical protein